MSVRKLRLTLGFCMFRSRLLSMIFKFYISIRIMARLV